MSAVPSRVDTKRMTFGPEAAGGIGGTGCSRRDSAATLGASWLMRVLTGWGAAVGEYGAAVGAGGGVALGSTTAVNVASKRISADAVGVSRMGDDPSRPGSRLQARLPRIRTIRAAICRIMRSLPPLPG